MEMLDVIKENIIQKTTAVAWNSEEMNSYAEAISSVFELSDTAKKDGILFLDDAVNELENAVPLKNFLLEIVKIYINGYSLDEYISKNIDSIPEGVDAAIFYIYSYASMKLQVLDQDNYYAEILSFIPIDKRDNFSKIFEAVNRKNIDRKAERYIERFLTTVTYSDDPVMASYIEATCKEISELTDRDLLYLYLQASEKFDKFLPYSDIDYRNRMYKLVKNKDMYDRALKYGEYYNSICKFDGRVRIEAMSTTGYIVMDVHEVIFNAYSAGELEGGSDIILYPDVKERDVNDRLRNMGF